MDNGRFKFGLFGVGHLGSIHLKCLGMIEQAEIRGFYDPDDEVAEQAMENYDVERFDSVDALLEAVDIADIVAPTKEHFDLAKRALEHHCHVFIEKPVCSDLEEGELLLKISEQGNQKVQIGHVERFNPAMLALRDEELDPKFIEGHRLSTFNPRGTDVSVVMDLMIHDLDIVLQLVSSNVVDVQANGVSVVSETPDICNARITFENGCVANLTASRISFKQLRKIRLFQRDAYISMDFLEKSSEVIRLFDEGSDNIPEDGEFFELDTPTGKKKIQMTKPTPPEVNAIKMELDTFCNCIREDRRPPVSLEDGVRAMRLAAQITGEVNKNLMNV